MEIKNDISGAMMPGNEKIKEVFDILSAEAQQGILKSFVLMADFSEQRSRELGEPLGKTRATMSMFGGGKDIMILGINFIKQIDTQMGTAVAMHVISTYLNEKMAELLAAEMRINPKKYEKT